MTTSAPAIARPHAKLPPYAAPAVGRGGTRPAGQACVMLETMNRHASLFAMLLIVAAASAYAQDKGYWRAASKNASSITGDVALSNDKVSINFLAFTIAPIRALKPEEAVAAFDADSTIPGGGNLFRLNIPGATRFLHKNTLCGGDDTQWMATYASGKSLRIAFFSGAAPPVLTIDALANSSDVCGTYTYVR